MIAAYWTHASIPSCPRDSITVTTTTLSNTLCQRKVPQTAVSFMSELCHKHKTVGIKYNSTISLLHSLITEWKIGRIYHSGSQFAYGYANYKRRDKELQAPRRGQRLFPSCTDFLFKLSHFETFTLHVLTILTDLLARIVLYSTYTIRDLLFAHRLR